MKKTIRYTPEQLKSAYDLLDGKSADRKKVGFYHSFWDPENLYLKYTGFSMLDDGSIKSENFFNCITPNGEIQDCFKDYTMREKLQFIVDCIAIDIDKRGKMVMI